MYSNTDLPIRPEMRESHQVVWGQIGKTGSYWSGRDRVSIVHEARASLECALCLQRKDALSPNAVSGDHDSPTDLASPVVDLIHRIRTDPARFTKSVFEDFCSSHSIGQYVELISVVACSVVVDTFHASLGLELPALAEGDATEPRGEEPALVEDAGAWLPLAQHEQSRTDLGFRRVPNILRAMGSVPSAVTLFFTCFRHHYSMMGVPLDLAQSQTEFIASRVSALNQCFY